MIVVLGDVMTDVIVRRSGPLALGTDREAEIAWHPGGSGANVACWIGYLGSPVCLVAKVGADDLTNQAEILRRFDVIPRLVADLHASTGTVIAIVDASGERSFYTDRGANLGMRASDVPASLLDNANWLHVSGYALFADAPREAALATIRVARQHDIGFSVDTGSTALLAATGRAAFLDWTYGATICFCNAPESALLRASADDYGYLVSTHGQSGAMVQVQGKTYAEPTVAVHGAETTGAGDAFVAGFLHRFVAKADLRSCLQFAVQTASIAVRTTGARPRLASTNISI